MDIDYLLLLQNFRNGVGAFLAPFLLWASEFAVSFWAFAIICMIYWVFDRKGGKRILSGFGLGLLANGFLKLTFCVYRPWIRDARVLPYGDSKVSATGYSFPSGHSTWATSIFGNTGRWFQKHGKKVLTAIFWIFMFVVMFSRNYLGVHTPQDVIVGFLSTTLMIFIANKIEDWTDQDHSKDKIVMIGGILLCVALCLYYQFKSYPLMYLEDGSLLVDPNKMKADSFQGLGFVSVFAICRFFERKGYDFEQIHWKDRFVISAFAIIPLYIWIMIIYPMIKQSLGGAIGQYIEYAGMAIYTMIIVPNVMKCIHEKKILK